MKSIKLNILLSFGLVLFLSCHTTIFHNVEKRIQGTWIRTPIPDTINPDSVPLWTFEEGKLSIVNRVYKGGGDPSTYFPDTVDYEVINSITRHLIFVEFDILDDSYYTILANTPDSLLNEQFIFDLKREWTRRLIEKWQVIKMSKSQMYLSKINATGADYVSSGAADMDGTNKGYDLTGNVQIGFIRK
tara:strand:+ start:201 stop:764 length:564 start_codon:yes stop_codon:yes gene_type:complete